MLFITRSSSTDTNAMMLMVSLKLLCLASIAAAARNSSEAAPAPQQPYQQLQQQQDDYYLGRSTRGIWRNISYTIFHYAEWTEGGGPSKKLSCARNSLENSFASAVVDSTNTSSSGTVEEMTQVEIQQVLRDVMAAERDEEALVSQMRTSQDTMRAQFEERWGQSGAAGGADPVNYMVHASVALYLKSDGVGGDNIWVDAFGSDIVKTLLSEQAVPEDTTALELETFVVQEAKKLAAPGVPMDDQYAPFVFDDDYYARRPLTLNIAFHATEECVRALHGDYWEEQEIQDKFFTYNTVVGRSVTGLWEERQYEIISFVQLTNVIRLGDDNQVRCFHETVESLFVDADDAAEDHEVLQDMETTATARSISNSSWTSSLIMDLSADQKAQAKNVTFGEIALTANNPLPFFGGNFSAPVAIPKVNMFWPNSEFTYLDGNFGRLTTTVANATFRMSFRSGVAVYLDGTYMRYFPDEEGPEDGFNAVIKAQLESLLVQNEEDFGLVPTAAPVKDDDYDWDDDYAYQPPFFVHLLPALLGQECNATTTSATTSPEKYHLRH